MFFSSTATYSCVAHTVPTIIRAWDKNDMALVLGVQGAFGGAMIGAVVGVVAGMWQNTEEPLKHAHTKVVTDVLGLHLDADTEDAVCMLAGLAPDHPGIIQTLAKGLRELEHLSGTKPANTQVRTVLARSSAAHSAAREVRDAIVDLEVTQGTPSTDFTTHADILEAVIVTHLFNVNIDS